MRRPPCAVQRGQGRSSYIDEAPYKELTSLPRRLGENDAWIAGTALAYQATLVGRERAFARVPRLDYLAF
jgi:predicted nucleic acid-binding protein